MLNFTERTAKKITLQSETSLYRLFQLNPLMFLPSTTERENNINTLESSSSKVKELKKSQSIQFSWMHLLFVGQNAQHKFQGES